MSRFCRKVVVYGLMIVWAVIAIGIIVHICWSLQPEEYRMIARTDSDYEYVGITPEEKTTAAESAAEPSDLTVQTELAENSAAEIAAEPEDGRDLAYDPDACCYDDTEITINDRYAGISFTDADIDLLADITWLEAGSVSSECQQAVAEVILNRVVSDQFPGTISDVIYQSKPRTQFTTAKYADRADPNGDTYDAIMNALYGDLLTPKDVVYFSLAGENSRIWRTIDGVVFCYDYIW